MVVDELANGERIARLLSSEIHGHQRGALGRLDVADAREEIEPTAAGAYAYAVETDAGRRVAEVAVHPDRCHVAFQAAVTTAADTGHREGLRVRPKAVEPPRTLVFVENGAEVKLALRVVRAVGEVLEDTG